MILNSKIIHGGERCKIHEGRTKIINIIVDNRTNLRSITEILEALLKKTLIHAYLVREVSDALY